MLYFNAGFPTYMAYQSALQTTMNGGAAGVQQQATHTLVNNLTQQGNTNNGLPAVPEQRQLPQVHNTLC